MNRLDIKLGEIDFNRVTQELPDKTQKEITYHITNIYNYYNTPMPLPEVKPKPVQKLSVLELPSPIDTRQIEDTFLNRHPIINRLHEVATCPMCAPNRPLYKEFAISGGILVLLAKVGGLI
jgi:hypothetical protein